MDAWSHTFCAESLSSSTTVYNRKGGLKSYVLLHDKCLSGAATVSMLSGNRHVDMSKPPSQ